MLQPTPLRDSSSPPDLSGVTKNDIRKQPAQRLIDSVMLVKIGALGELEDKCEKGYRFSSFDNRKTVLFLWLESSLS